MSRIGQPIRRIIVEPEPRTEPVPEPEKQPEREPAPV